MSALPLLFGLQQRVTRVPYVVAGLLLAVLKFSIDFAIVYGFTGRSWHPLGYLVPSMILRTQDLGSVPRHVTTSIEVDAPPEAVWPNVIGFTEFQPPPEWFFKLGIAYPRR